MFPGRLHFRFSPRRVWVVLAAVALFCAAFPALAHTPFLMVSLTDAGQVRVEVGFSDGSTGEGLPIEFLSLDNGASLGKFTVPAEGVFEVPPPDVPYEVVLDAGAAHRVSKDGPLPEAKAPAAATLLLVNAHGGDPAQWTVDERDAIAAAQVIVAQEFLAQRTPDAWEGKTLVLLESGVALGADSAVAKDLRGKTLARIRAALDQGEAVAVLTYDAPESDPDWAWLLNDEPRAAVAGKAAP
ncbi:MAG: hypothetical protein GC168_20845 [Candidatus Hydrogenedens sp.]|nr:hypothetical protein [Candidatus Hydrogenedens sp.]